MADIKKYNLKNFYSCVIFRPKIWQKNSLDFLKVSILNEAPVASFKAVNCQVHGSDSDGALFENAFLYFRKLFLIATK
jgi:hypothetical protein